MQLCIITNIKKETDYSDKILFLEFCNDYIILYASLSFCFITKQIDYYSISNRPRQNECTILKNIISIYHNNLKAIQQNFNICDWYKL